MRMLLVLAFIFAPLLCAQQFEAGEKAFVEGRMQDAVDAFTKVIAADPKHDRALGFRAAAYTALGKSKEAEADAEAAIKMGTTFSLAFNTRGYLLWQSGAYVAAIEDFTAAIALAASDESVGASGRARIYQNRGVAYQDIGNLDRALMDFNRCIELQPTGAEYYENRGLVYMDKGLFDVAWRDFDRAVEYGPRSPRAYVNRAFAARSMDDLEQAVRDYSQALRLKPDYAQALIGRGHTWIAWERLEPARADFEAASKIEGFKASGLAGMGEVALLRGRLVDAIAEFTSAVAADPRHVPARRGLVVALTASGRCPEARPHAVALCAQVPGNAWHWTLLARVCFESEDLVQSLVAADRALELDASSIEARTLRLRARATRGEYELALADARRLQDFDKAAGLVESARVNALRSDELYWPQVLKDLADAKAAGADIATLAADKDFRRLRDSAEFKKLTAE